MDVELRASRVYLAKHLPAAQASAHHSETHSIKDDQEDGACFPCPFCFVDIELSLLYTHLEDEHCFDLKNAVCPVCAANLGKDAIGHFGVQHSNMLKRNKKSPQTSSWPSNTPILGKELRELSSFLRAGSPNYRVMPSETAPDPLLSPFVCGIVLPNTKISQEVGHALDQEFASDPNSRGLCESDEAQEKANEEARQRAEFSQQLLFSTIL